MKTIAMFLEENSNNNKTITLIIITIIEERRITSIAMQGTEGVTSGITTVNNLTILNLYSLSNQRMKSNNMSSGEQIRQR